jgi:hypothetical protein
VASVDIGSDRDSNAVIPGGRVREAVIWAENEYVKFRETDFSELNRF